MIVWIFFVSSAYRYTPETKKFKISKNWWAQVDSNHRPHAYQACALTTWAMSPCCYLRCVSPTCPSSFRKWWRWTGSNRWPPACKAGALPAELHPRAWAAPQKLNNDFSEPFLISLTLDVKQIFFNPLCLHRKEVIQPPLPIRLPCYDFTPVAYPTFGHALLAVRLWTSGVTNSHGVTGGVYKARERIHRGMLIRDY